MEIPVYLMTGFLESGKTSFILEALNDKEFSRGEKTLVISCEQGEVEYDERILKASKSVVEYIEDEEDFNPENLTALVFFSGFCSTSFLKDCISARFLKSTFHFCNLQ